VAGLLMAIFIAVHNAVLNIRLSLRVRHGRYRVAFSIAECAVVALITCTIVFLATYFSPCADIPAAYATASEHDLEAWFERGNCPHGQYSRFGQLFFTSLGNAASILFNLDTVSLTGEVQPFHFDVGALFAYFGFTYMITPITFGLGVPTGVFIPSLLMGACLGNLFGRLVALIAASPGINSDIAICLHAYTVIGAGAMLAGVTRMTLSVCVLIIETTGSYPVLVPIMLSVFTARAVGDLFGNSIYKSVIKHRGVPYMEEHKLDGVRFPVSDKLDVADVMTEAIVALPPVITVRKLVDLLKHHKHGAFPVTDDPGSTDDDNQPVVLCGGRGMPFYGAVRRDTLLKILEHRVGFVPLGQSTPDPKGVRRIDAFRCAREGALGSEVHRSYEKLLSQLQGLPYKPRPIGELENGLCVDGYMDTCEIDVTPFMSRSPHTTSSAATLSRAYRLFRTLGLRHLWVVAPVPRIVGVVTRKDIIEDNATLVFAEKIAEHMADEGASYAGPFMSATEPYNAPLARGNSDVDRLESAGQPTARQANILRSTSRTGLHQRRGRGGQAQPPSSARAENQPNP